MLTIYIIMTSLKRLPDKHGGKVCENICLQERHQYLDKINEYYKRN